MSTARMNYRDLIDIPEIDYIPRNARTLATDAVIVRSDPAPPPPAREMNRGQSIGRFVDMGATWGDGICLFCQEPFTKRAANQKYCSKKECKRASIQATQRRSRMKHPRNRRAA